MYTYSTSVRLAADTPDAGVRHVPKEEDQVRWEDASLHALPQLQDGVRLYSSREEAKSAQRVRRLCLCPITVFSFSTGSIVPNTSRAWKTDWDAWRRS